MTSKERITRMFQHREADRVPIIDNPWAGTLMRWKREGMPENADWREFFGTDYLENIDVDISPRFPREILEETDRYTIEKTAWGVTLKQFKELDATPEFLDFSINTPEAWEKAKARMAFDPQRINWAFLEREYPKWTAQGRFIQAGFWFGFDVTHSWMAGTETLLVALLEEPEWARDMFDTYLDMCIAHFDAVWDAGYRFDSILWYDDMGYKNTPFFSNALYRELLQPAHRRAVEWAHQKGIYARLHSCGFIEPLLPDILETGVDALNPLEVKAGMDPLKIKREYGDRLTLHGGFSALLWDHQEQIVAEIAEKLPVLKENGGYIFASDHSIPNSVSLEDFRVIMEAVKKHGAYSQGT